MRSVDLRKLPSRARGASASNWDFQSIQILFVIWHYTATALGRFTLYIGPHTYSYERTASCNVSKLKLLSRFYSQIQSLPHSDRCTASTDQLMHSGERIDVFVQQGSARVSHCCLNRDCIRSVTYRRDTSVGAATRYGMDGPGFKCRGEIFAAPVQTGPGAHPASYTLGTASFPGGKAAGAWGWPPNPILAPRLKRKSRAIPLLPPWAFLACSRVNFYMSSARQRGKVQRRAYRMIRATICRNTWDKLPCC